MKVWFGWFKEWDKDELESKYIKYYLGKIEKGEEKISTLLKPLEGSTGIQEERNEVNYELSNFSNQLGNLGNKIVVNNTDFLKLKEDIKNKY